MNTYTNQDKLIASDAMTAGLTRKINVVDSFYPAHNEVKVVVTRVDGSVEKSEFLNMRTSAGSTFWYNQIANGGGSVSAIAQWLGLSSASLTLALADTTLASEITTNGCARAVGTIGSYVAPTTTSGAGQNFSYTNSHTWTATSTQTVQSAGTFTAITAGTLVLEGNFASSITLNNGDSLTLTWSVSS